MDTAFTTEKETIPVGESVHRILAEDVFSAITMPPFNKSMVDGFAIQKKDIGDELVIEGLIPAGETEDYLLQQGHCMKIMTGAPVPNGADMVVMVEDVDVQDNMIRIKNQRSSVNISPMGEDIREGDLVLPNGTLIKPFHSGILATIGLDSVHVYKKPSIGIIVTGNEIIEPGKKLEKGQIYNCNGTQLISFCRSLDLEAEYYGIVEDTYKATEEAIRFALEKHDVLIITGGVSMGELDYVAPAIKNSGLNVCFDSIAAQPGRPLVFARNEQKFCFGMPGNPVSGLVLFETIVKPMLYRIMGHEFFAPVFPFVLGQTISRKKAVRKSWYPVKLDPEGTVSPLIYHGSAHISAYANAFGIMFLDIGELEKKAGETIYVRQI
ncbi:MAG TPA: molybdopterin molybdenumtransferase MoeA [Saprospirales bacterium]|nr:molybdopterin molybdenumtransferase MoeA [Saprospirales bacterium]